MQGMCEERNANLRHRPSDQETGEVQQAGTFKTLRHDGLRGIYGKLQGQIRTTTYHLQCRLAVNLQNAVPLDTRGCVSLAHRSTPLHARHTQKTKSVIFTTSLGMPEELESCFTEISVHKCAETALT